MGRFILTLYSIMEYEKKNDRDHMTENKHINNGKTIRIVYRQQDNKEV